MQFIDLKPQYLLLQETIEARLQKVFDHCQFIMGPEVLELETALAKYVGVRHCVTMSSGTLALQLALMALEVGPGDEIITTPFSFFATAGTILLLGATPIFVDIEPATYNLDPEKIEAAITEKTKAIMPVSLFGQCVNLTRINEIAKKYNIPVIEDGAQSFGATHYGRLSCGLTTIGCTSFFPSKPLACYGDGGACFTDDDEIAERLRILRNHGQVSRYHHLHVGTNARLDTLQAAILLEKLKVFDEEVEKRQMVAHWYQNYLADTYLTPFIAPENKSVYAQYTIQTDHRDVVSQAMADMNIPTAVHYPIPLHKQPILQNKFERNNKYPIAETMATRVLSLPFYPYLTEEDVRRISAALIRIFELSHGSLSKIA